MPSLIETRPFTIHPDLYAWPSFRFYSRRAVWAYLVLLLVVAALIKYGMSMSFAMAGLLALALLIIAVGLSFIRYKSFLAKPAHRELFRNVVVSLDDEQIRQDYTDGSHLSIQLFAITGFHEVGDFYFVFATRQYGIVVPKTAFESPEESKEFASRIQGAVQKK